MLSFFKKKTTKKTETTQKIEYKGATKFAENETDDMYLDFEELGGFPYLKTLIIGGFSTKIKRTGGTITFVFENEKLTLNSDNTDIESNQIKNTNAFYTEIDFELDESDVEKIKNNKIIEIQYGLKNSHLQFKPVKN